MIATLPKPAVPTHRKPRATAAQVEERSLLKFNRLLVQAAPRAARATAAALNRFHRDIAAEIRRAG